MSWPKSYATINDGCSNEYCVRVKFTNAAGQPMYKCTVCFAVHKPGVDPKPERNFTSKISDAIHFKKTGIQRNKRMKLTFSGD